MTAGATTSAPTGSPTPRRGRRRRALVLGIVVTVLAATGAVVGVNLVAAPAQTPSVARVCADDGTGCAPLQETAASTPRWALLPVDDRGRLRVRAGDASGEVGIGVAAYLDASDAGAVRVLAGTTTTGGVVLADGATKTLQLSGVPDGAQLVLVRTDGVAPDTDVAAGCSRNAAGECRDLSVSAHTIVATPSAAALAGLLMGRHGIAAAAARTAASAVADELTARADAPAHIAATIASGDGLLRVDWVLSTGGETVTSVRITLRPKGTDTPTRTHAAIAATGSYVLRGLDRRTQYVVDVAPVVQTGTSSVAGAPVELAAVPNGSPATSGPTTPTAPAGWTPLIQQGFDRSAALGRFADVYPGWSWYDGMTETSRETNRPRAQVGVWQSATTTSVHDGMLDCHLWTKGKQPQVCAITPTPNDAIWHGQLYGRYSVRFKSDPVPGYKIAWLLWPNTDDWTNGEIDFPEASLDGTITGSTHRTDGDPSDFAYFVDTAQALGGWHTATIDWEPGRLTFILDGQSWTTTAKAGLPTVPMRWTLQAETEIQDAAPDPAAKGDILIDWVAAWSRAR